MPPSIEILLVEDNPADVKLTQRAMVKGELRNTVHVAVDGVEAMQFLRKQAPFENAITPDIVLLDLNLPRKSGREVLTEIKADSELRRLPVVVLVSSDADARMLAREKLLACGILSKPVNMKQFEQIARLIENVRLQ